MKRTGVTTGLCAAAAAKAAATILLSSKEIEKIFIRARNGAEISFYLADTIYERGSVKCAVVKDAGDDPDVTDGIKIFAAVSKIQTGIEIEGGIGVGRVTKPGLKIPPGKAAINPVPMEMIRSAAAEVCAEFSYAGGIRVVISVPDGAEAAKKTMNERLGVVGGISILGTTGIVEPMSSRAVLETIKTEIDVQTAPGKKNLLITPGNYGRGFAEQVLKLNIGDAVKCSNFIGETLDYACEKSIERITLVGHAGKLVKLAGGVMNTHSRVADCRMEIIAAHCAMAGAGQEIIRRVMECVTVEGAIEVMNETGLNETVWQSIGRKIEFHLHSRAKKIRTEFIVFTQEHGILTRGETL